MYPQKRAFKIQDCHMKFFVDISPGKAFGGKMLAVNVFYLNMDGLGNKTPLKVFLIN